MISRKKEFSSCLLLLVLLLTQTIPFYGFSQAPQTDAASGSQVENPPEIIRPAPQNTKEKVGVYVFLGWLWLSVLVLLYFLRLKIQEADRLYELEFYPHPKNESLK